MLPTNEFQGGSSPWGKADQLRPPSVQVTIVWSYTSTTHVIAVVN
jgi:hypothetical protein